MTSRTPLAALFVIALGAAVAGACSDDDSAGSGASSGAGGGGGGGGVGGRPENTGAACEVADDCYTSVVDGGLEGEAQCLDRVRDGYCTHECASDDDCCAAEGECDNGESQVCSPFESTGTMMCFLACEKDDVGEQDDQEFCQAQAGKDFICRSSGGGSNNRKICVPGTCGVGADCSTADDCTGDLDCVLGAQGGYCGKGDCEGNDDCPADSLCVAHSDGSNYCLRTCGSETDCSFCRSSSVSAACSDSVDFVDAQTTGSVCLL